jgi:hypothetical protein
MDAVNAERPKPEARATDDPVLARRHRISRMADLGQRIGYGLYGVAIVAFFVAFFTDFRPGWVTVIVASMLIGSAFLAPAIVAGYAVKAAEREDREQGR